jgi:hypothetical protein
LVAGSLPPGHLVAADTLDEVPYFEDTDGRQDTIDRQTTGADHLVDGCRTGIDDLQDTLFQFIELQFGRLTDHIAARARGGFD